MIEQYCYLRKGIFERNKKFECRVEYALNFLSERYEILNYSLFPNSILIRFREKQEDQTKSVIGFHSK